MATLKLMPFAPTLIPEKRYAVNGRMPSPNALGRAAQAINTVAGFGRQIANYSLDTQSTPAGGISQTLHHFLFRSGENPGKLSAIIGIAPADNTFAGNQAGVRLEVDAGAGAITSDFAYYPEVASGIYGANAIHWARLSIDTADGYAADTQYHCTFRASSYARIHAICLFEEAPEDADTTVTGVCDAQAFEQGKPIYGSSIQDVLQAGTKLWQHNGPILFEFSCRTHANAPTPSGTTWENLLKSSASSFGANDPGINLRTTYHDTVSGDIPCELAVYGARTSGTGTLDVKLVRSSGDIVTVSGFTSGTSTIPGEVQSFTMPAMDELVQVFVRCSDAGTAWRIDSLAFWEYEA